MTLLGVDAMQFIDKDQFREDMLKLLSEQDTDILLRLYDLRRGQVPVKVIATALGLTEGRVKHRILKSLDLLRRVAGYAVILQRAIEGLDADPETPKSN